MGEKEKKNYRISLIILIIIFRCTPQSHLISYVFSYTVARLLGARGTPGRLGKNLGERGNWVIMT